MKTIVLASALMAILVSGCGAEHQPSAQNPTPLQNISTANTGCNPIRAEDGITILRCRMLYASILLYIDDKSGEITKSCSETKEETCE